MFCTLKLCEIGKKSVKILGKNRSDKKYHWVLKRSMRGARVRDVRAALRTSKRSERRAGAQEVLLLCFGFLFVSLFLCLWFEKKPISRHSREQGWFQHHGQQQPAEPRCPTATSLWARLPLSPPTTKWLRFYSFICFVALVVFSTLLLYSVSTPGS